jgi:hypothetical protein
MGLQNILRLQGIKPGGGTPPITNPGVGMIPMAGGSGGGGGMIAKLLGGSSGGGAPDLLSKITGGGGTPGRNVPPAARPDGGGGGYAALIDKVRNFQNQDKGGLVNRDAQSQAIMEMLKLATVRDEKQQAVLDESTDVDRAVEDVVQPPPKGILGSLANMGLTIGRSLPGIAGGLFQLGEYTTRKIAGDKADYNNVFYAAEGQQKIQAESREVAAAQRELDAANAKLDQKSKLVSDLLNIDAKGLAILTDSGALMRGDLNMETTMNAIYDGLWGQAAAEAASNPDGRISDATKQKYLEAGGDLGLIDMMAKETREIQAMKKVQNQATTTLMENSVTMIDVSNQTASANRDIAQSQVTQLANTISRMKLDTLGQILPNWDVYKESDNGLQMAAKILGGKWIDLPNSPELQKEFDDIQSMWHKEMAKVQNLPKELLGVKDILSLNQQARDSFLNFNLQATTDAAMRNLMAEITTLETLGGKENAAGMRLFGEAMVMRYVARPGAKAIEGQMSWGQNAQEYVDFFFPQHGREVFDPNFKNPDARLDPNRQPTEPRAEAIRIMDTIKDEGVKTQLDSLQEKYEAYFYENPNAMISLLQQYEDLLVQGDQAAVSALRLMEQQIQKASSN